MLSYLSCPEGFSKGVHQIREGSVERFSSLIRAKLRDDDATLRRNYLRLFVGKVIVGGGSSEQGHAGDVIIQGSSSTLEDAALAASASKTGQVPIFDAGMVPLARLERARLSTIDFESIASTIPPQGHIQDHALNRKAP